VVDPRAAHLLSRLVEDEHLDLPDPMRDDSVCVYYKRKRSGKYEERDYYVWEREFMDCMVTSGDLRSRPSEFVVNLGFFGFAELIDIRPEVGTPFVYSMSEAFDEEDLEERVMHNWLRHFGLRYHQLHASGHLSRGELVEAIEGIGPRRLFPVHTESPELFREHFDCVTVPVVEEEYRL
jgi:ribonuclease J